MIAFPRRVARRFRAACAKCVAGRPRGPAPPVMIRQAKNRVTLTATFPEVILELAASTRSMKERLVNYFKQMQEQNNQQVKQQHQVEMQSTMMNAQAAMGLANAEATKARAEAGNVALEAQRKRSEDTVTAYLDTQEMHRKRSLDAANSFLKVLELWEKSDTTEKQQLMDLYMQSQQLQNQNQGV